MWSLAYSISQTPGQVSPIKHFTPVRKLYPLMVVFKIETSLSSDIPRYVHILPLFFSSAWAKAKHKNGFQALTTTTNFLDLF